MLETLESSRFVFGGLEKALVVVMMTAAEFAEQATEHFACIISFTPLITK